nr:prepilin-type N-terminal cleavage/methylation domain-containing protein [uncultured Desulfobacter sp.]
MRIWKTIKIPPMPWARHPRDLFTLKNGTAAIGSNGFTLIEALIALMVLSVGLLSIAVMQIDAIHGNSQGSHVTEATSLIEKKLEGYKSLDYEDVKDEQGNEDIYQWVTTVQENTPVNSLKTVTVKVTWASGTRSHSLSFGTIIAK